MLPYVFEPHRQSVMVSKGLSQLIISVMSSSRWFEVARWLGGCLVVRGARAQWHG